MQDPIGRPWRRPFFWPPHKWHFTPQQQAFSDIICGVGFLAVFVILTAAIVALFAIPIHAIGAVISGRHEEARNLLLALAALLGAPFLVWRTLIAAQQITISRETLLTQLFTSGVERLGAEKTAKVVKETPRFKKIGEEWEKDKAGNLVPAKRPDGQPLIEIKVYEKTVLNIEVRLGAVYALERVAMDSNRDSAPIVQTLAAYIRNNFSIANTDEQKTNLSSRPDIQEALAVLSRCSNYIQNPPKIDLSGVNFENHTFMDGSLEKCDLYNSRATKIDIFRFSFRGSSFRETDWGIANSHSVDFYECKFVDAKFDALDCIACNLSSIKINTMNVNKLHLTACNISKAQIVRLAATNARIRNSRIDGCRFYDCDLRQSIFSGRPADTIIFEDTDISFSVIENANASFHQCNLTGIQIPEGCSFDREQNFIASDEWILEQREQGVFAELILMQIHHQWQNWLQNRLKHTS